MWDEEVRSNSTQNLYEFRARCKLCVFPLTLYPGQSSLSIYSLPYTHTLHLPRLHLTVDNVNLVMNYKKPTITNLIFEPTMKLIELHPLHMRLSHTSNYADYVTYSSWSHRGDVIQIPV